MPLTARQLPRARVGRAVTAQAWNELIEGVDAFYDAFGTLGHEYVQVDVTFRQGPAPGARVVAVPVDAGGKPSGPPVEAAPTGGDGTEFRLPATGAGRWTFYAQAPGFGLEQTTAPIPADSTPGPIAKVDLELAATHLFVPDVVSLRTDLATTLLVWSGFSRGVVADIFRQVDGTRPVSDNIDGRVLLQGPGAGTAVPRPAGATIMTPATAVNMMHRAFSDPTKPFVGENAPTRTLAPDMLGFPASRLPAIAANRGVIAPPVVAGTERRLIVDQQPSAGEVMAVNTPIAVTLLDADPATVTLGRFAGTHAGLADMTAGALVRGLAETPLAGAFGFLSWGLTPPWSIARRSLGDGEVDALRSHFEDVLQVRVTADGGSPLDRARSLAAAWQTLHVAQVVANQGA